MGFLETREFKEYESYNKSLFFLLPLLAEDKKGHKDFLFKDAIFNTYLRGFKYDHLKRPLYIHYKFSDTKEFKDLEEYLTMDLNNNTFIDSLDISEKEIIVCYDITNTTPYPDNSKLESNDSWVTDYDLVMQGNYYKLSTRHKLKVLEFFYDRQCSYDNFLKLLFGRSQILWEMRRKNLGCRWGDGCKCNVQTKLIEITTDSGEKRTVPRAMEKQSYLKCKDYEHWNMPHNVELESAPDINKETYRNVYQKEKIIAT